MFSIFLFFYTLLLAFGATLYLPVLLFQRLARGKKSAIFPRFGFGSNFKIRTPLDQESRIWIHAVSVGEVNAIRPLAEALIQKGHTVLISTTTYTGQEVASTIFKGKAATFFFPLDFRFLCRRAIRRLKPSLVLLAETEIWPNFLASCQEARIPVILINGRISEGSFKRYRRFRFFFKYVLSLITHFCMQTKRDRERIVEMGAREARANWMGNLKFDYRLDRDPKIQETLDQLSSHLQLGPKNLLLVCGSTKPGEEEMLARVYSRLRNSFATLRILVAPRHPHRGKEVARVFEDLGFSVILRSQLTEVDSGTSFDVAILDSVGELAHVYQLAEIVFVGGSLVPTGGQNIIEPAVFGKPILFGPHMGNFREISEAFLQSYAALQVRSAEELESKIQDLLGDEHSRSWLGRNARNVIRKNQGAIERTVEVIESYLRKTA